MINRDILGTVRRALRISLDPPRPEMLGVIQPTSEIFKFNSFDHVTAIISNLNAIGAGAGSVILTFPADKHGFILNCWVVISDARTLTVNLNVDIGTTTQGIMFYYMTGALAGHIPVGGLFASATIFLPSAHRVYVPPRREPGLGTEIQFDYGGGAAGQTISIRMLIAAFDRFDPIDLI